VQIVGPSPLGDGPFVVNLSSFRQELRASLSPEEIRSSDGAGLHVIDGEMPAWTPVKAHSIEKANARSP